MDPNYQIKGYGSNLPRTEESKTSRVGKKVNETTKKASGFINKLRNSGQTTLEKIKQSRVSLKSSKSVSEIKTSLKSFPNQPLLKRAFEQFSPILIGSERNQKLFYEMMEKILPDDELPEMFSNYLDLYKTVFEEQLKLIQDPAFKVDRANYVLLDSVRLQMMARSAEVEAYETISPILLSLLDIAWVINTQLLTDVISNPLYTPGAEVAVGERGFVPFRGSSLDHFFTIGERMLTGAGYIPYANKLCFLFNEPIVLDSIPNPDNPTQNIVKSLKYIVSKAYPDIGVYETSIKLDLTDYLPEKPTFAQSKELIELFEKFTVTDRLELDTFLERKKNDFKEGKIMTFLNQEKFDSLINQLSFLVGTSTTYGEIDRKLAAVSVAPWIVFDEYVKDKTGIFQRLLQLVGLYHLNEAGSEKVFAHLLKIVDKIENSQDVEIKSERLIQEFYELIKNPRGYQLLDDFTNYHNRENYYETRMKLFEFIGDDFPAIARFLNEVRVE